MHEPSRQDTVDEFSTDQDMRNAWEELDGFLNDSPSGGQTAEPDIPEKIRNAYKVLGVAPEASLPQVQIAYKKLLQTFHPDRNDSADAGENTRKIVESYRIIRTWRKESR